MFTVDFKHMLVHFQLLQLIILKSFSRQNGKIVGKLGFGKFANPVVETFRLISHPSNNIIQRDALHITSRTKNAANLTFSLSFFSSLRLAEWPARKGFPCARRAPP